MYKIDIRIIILIFTKAFLITYIIKILFTSNNIFTIDLILIFFIIVLLGLLSLYTYQLYLSTKANCTNIEIGTQNKFVLGCNNSFKFSPSEETFDKKKDVLEHANNKLLTGSHNHFSVGCQNSVHITPVANATLNINIKSKKNP